MARTLAIDWDDVELRLVVANVQTDRITIENAVSTRIENDPTETGDIGQRIAEAMRKHKIKATEAVVGIGRSQVELRTVTVPPVPENELPDLIRFQSLREFSEVSEDWPIDFLPVHIRESETTVQVATISPKRVAEVKNELSKAELETAGLILRPTATAALVPDEETSLVVDDLEHVVELTVVRGGEIHIMRTVQLPSGPIRISGLLNEIRRTLMASGNQPNLKVSRVVFFGKPEEHDAISKEVREKLKLATHSFDPFHHVAYIRSDLKETGRFANAIGMLVDRSAETRSTIDFLNPRRKPEPPSRKRQYSMLTVAAIVLLVVCGGGLWWRLHSMDKQISSLQTQAQKLTKVAEQAQLRIGERDRIKDWIARDVIWLNELDYMSKKLLDPDQIRLKTFDASITANGDGKIDLDGFTNDQMFVTEFEKRIDGNRSIRGDVSTRDDNDSRYPWRFKEIITIENEIPKKNPNSRRNMGRGNQIPNRRPISGRGS